MVYIQQLQPVGVKKTSLNSPSTLHKQYVYHELIDVVELDHHVKALHEIFRIPHADHQTTVTAGKQACSYCEKRTKRNTVARFLCMDYITANVHVCGITNDKLFSTHKTETTLFLTIVKLMLFVLL